MKRRQKKRPPVAQKEEEVSDDFQGYHHRRQKELNSRILICVINVNPLPCKTPLKFLTSGKSTS
ncbi:MAG: hypothetical protein B6I25_00070 [Planctomycetales bacterium 4572_13]|nr:MAG: hypothetical protein B6I25_00070 [Planctomycetales bacterium 4572_13]